MTGDLLNHHLFGQGLGAIEVDPAKQAVAAPDSFHNPGTVQRGFNSFVGNSQVLNPGNGTHLVSLANHMSTIPDTPGAYPSPPVYGNDQIESMRNDMRSLQIPHEFEGVNLNPSSTDSPVMLAGILNTDLLEISLFLTLTNQDHGLIIIM